MYKDQDYGGEVTPDRNVPGRNEQQGGEGRDAPQHQPQVAGEDKRSSDASMTSNMCCTMAQRSIATKLLRHGAYKISRRLGVTYLGDG